MPQPQDRNGFEARVISLRSSADRRAAVIANLMDLACAWRFFDALTAEAGARVDPSAARQIARFGRLLAPGEIGVFKSHLGVLDAFDADPGLAWLLVIEDDVWIDTAFPFDETIALLAARDIHYLRLFARRYKKADVLLQIGTRQLIRFRTDPYGAQAYLISRAGAARLRANIRSIDRPIDDEIARFWEHGLDIHAIFPFPAVERTMASTIETGRGVSQAAGPARGLVRTVNRTRDLIGKSLANLRFDLRERRRWRSMRRRGGAGLY